MVSESNLFQWAIQRYNHNKDNVVLLAAGIFCICFLLAGIGSEKYKYLAIPFIILSTPLLVFYPRLFIICFLGSFFFDNNVFVFYYHFGTIFMNLQDILALLFIAGYSAKYLFNTGKNKKIMSLPYSYKTSWTIRLLILFFFTSLVSLVINVYTFSEIDTLRSIAYLFHLLELIVVFVIITKEVSFASKDFFINWIIVFSLAESLIVGYQFFSALLHGFYYFRDVSGLYGHHCQIGNMMTISIACAIYKMFNTHLLGKKIAYLSLSFLFCWAIICSGSRSNLLGIICSVGLLILSKFRFNKRYVLGVLSLAIFSLFLIIFSPFKHLTDFTFKSAATGIDISSYQRIFIWKGALEHFIHAPLFMKLFGLGIGNYSNLHYSFLLETGKTTSGAHNNFLHVLMETGILGISIFIGFFISTIANLWKNGKEDIFAYFYVWVTIALLVSCFTQETFWFQISFGDFWLFYMIGLALALIKVPNQHGTMPSLQPKLK
jgi:O-antigen ligase